MCPVAFIYLAAGHQLVLGMYNYMLTNWRDDEGTKQ